MWIRNLRAFLVDFWFYCYCQWTREPGNNQVTQCGLIVKYPETQESGLDGRLSCISEPVVLALSTIQPVQSLHFQREIWTLPGEISFSNSDYSWQPYYFLITTDTVRHWPILDRPHWNDIHTLKRKNDKIEKLERKKEQRWKLRLRVVRVFKTLPGSRMNLFQAINLFEDNTLKSWGILLYSFKAWIVSDIFLGLE